MPPHPPVDLPESLHDAYQGPLSPLFADDFDYYAAAVLEHFGDRVKTWLVGAKEGGFRKGRERRGASRGCPSGQRVLQHLGGRVKTWLVDARLRVGGLLVCGLRGGPKGARVPHVPRC